MYTVKYKDTTKKANFYLRTSTINGNFRGLPGAVDNLSVDESVVI
jgi:hypothetical protein